MAGVLAVLQKIQQKEIIEIPAVGMQYGRHAILEIAKEVEGKTDVEVGKYSKKFWKRYNELNDAERIIKNIERGEQRIKRQQDIMSALAAKLSRYRNPWQELRLQYGANKGKVYTGSPPPPLPLLPNTPPHTFFPRPFIKGPSRR